MSAGLDEADTEADEAPIKAFNVERHICGSAICLALAVVCGVGIVVAGSHGLGRGHHRRLAAEPVEIEGKPRSDKRLYHFGRLSNGMEVVNVFDKQATSDAFAIAVDAGSLDDPAHLLGLAHFCEHMLFLGTATYPDPSGFDNFVNAHGGKTNAYTADDATVYYLELTAGSFDESLDRLGDFFRAPRLNESLVRKELHAIDSEHAKNREDPDRRLSAVLDSLASPLSPVSRFHTGNLDTLYRLPREQGTDPVKELRRWFDTHYCPSRIHLVTLSSLPLDRQLAKAERYFGNITARSRVCASPRKSWAEPAAWPADHLGKWVSISGKQPQVDLVLSFAFPDLTDKYESQPTIYLEHILTYGGEKSLLTTLRDELGLITSLSAAYTTSSAGGNFMLEFGLAQLGAVSPERVLDMFFGFVAGARAQGVDRQLYESLADARKLSWDWSESRSPSDAVSDLAERSTRLPAQKLLSGDTLIETLDAELVAMLLDLLRPHNMNAAFVAPGNLSGREGLAARDDDFASNIVQRLPYFDVDFSVAALSDKFPHGAERWERWLRSEFTAKERDELAGLMKDLIHEDAGKLADVSLPEPPRPIAGVPKEVSTSFMAVKKTHAKVGEFDSDVNGPPPEELDLVEAGVNRSAEAGNPRQSASFMQTRSTDVRAWFRQGWVTTSPKVHMMAAFRRWVTPDSWERPVPDVLRLILYSALLKKNLSSKLYDQALTGATYEITMSTDGILFEFDGYPSLFPKLIEGVLGGVISQFKPSQAQFDRAVYDMNETLRSYSDMPIIYAVQDRNLLLTANMHSKEEALAALGDLDLFQVASAADDLLFGSPLHLTSLVMGNVDEDVARNAVAAVHANWSARGVHGPSDGKLVHAAEILRTARILQLAQPVELRKRNPRAGDPNDVLVLSLIWGVATVESRVTLGLLGEMLGQLAFNELRTQQQLGYVVNAGDTMISNVHAVSVAVQGNAKNADEMEVIVESFLFNQMPAFLDDMDDDAFQSFKHAFRQRLLQRPNTHSDEFRHFWGSVAINESCFALRDQMMWFLEERLKTKALLVDAWSHLVLPNASMRKKIAVKYFAGDPPARRSSDEALSLFKEQEVPLLALEQLRHEFAATQVLGRADSTVRASLQKEGYYPLIAICEIPSEEHSELTSQRQLRDKFDNASHSGHAESEGIRGHGDLDAVPMEVLAETGSNRRSRRTRDAFLWPGDSRPSRQRLDAA